MILLKTFLIAWCVFWCANCFMEITNGFDLNPEYSFDAKSYFMAFCSMLICIAHLIGILFSFGLGMAIIFKVAIVILAICWTIFYVIHSITRFSKPCFIVGTIITAVLAVSNVLIFALL